MKHKKRFKNIIFVFTAILAVLIVISQSNAQTNPKPFAVAELFTSEGCSSCPPADSILRDITQQAESSGNNILTLSFHVDYWDYLGWKDPASDALYSARQRKYAQIFESRSVYTPQLVINGQNGFGGYKSNLAEKHIKEALNEQPKASLDITIDFVSNNEIGIKYETLNAPEKTKLNIALVERSVTTEVPRGENAGRTLKHANVVRVFETATLKNTSGKISVRKPQGFDSQKYAVIGYLQNPDTMKIIGADQSNIEI